MRLRASGGGRPGDVTPTLAFAPLLLLLLLLSALGVPSCKRPQPCQDPTREGVCFCPIGVSCHHECGQGTGHCTLGCSQGNPSCSVSCANDCTALCGGAGRCDAVCGDHC